jgi:signal transduction histidine kinase
MNPTPSTAPPPPAVLGALARRPRPAWLRRLLPDSVYVFAGLPYGIISFTVLIVGFSAGLGLAVTFLGLPILTGTLYVARGFATGERRAAARVLDEPEPRVRYKDAGPGAGFWRRVITPLTDAQYWLDLGHGLLALVTSIIAFVFVVTWWAGALGGTLYMAWSWALPDSPDDQRLHQLLGLPDTWLADNALNTILGLVFAASLPLIVRASAVLRAALVHGPFVAVGRYRDRISGLEAARDTAQAQTAAAVSAEATALRRLERDIHDGPQQRLVRLAMDLGRAQHQFETDPAAARATVAEALAQTRETLDELRALSRGIAPPILADRGLAAAVAALAGRSTVPVEIDNPDVGRLDPAVENAAYFVIAETLTNVAKHSRATECAVALRRDPHRMHIEIRDNGVGGAHVAKGHGLAGLADRVRALGGTFTVDSPVGGPTMVAAELPCG